MKILLLGENGSLGRQFTKLFNKKKIKFDAVSRKKQKVKFTYNILKKIVNKSKPNIIINCIALTGLIYCENNKREAFEINTNIPNYLVKIINKTNIKLIHFSTEAVFNGSKLNKIYNEKDIPNPRSIYGKSKLNADKIILKFPNTLIIRLPMIFGPTHKNQIISKLLIQLKKGKTVFVADDIYSTPIYSPDLSKFVYDNCIKNDFYFKEKIIHLTGENAYSIYDFIYNLSKNIKGINLNKIVKVKDAYFKSKIKIKPKNLGLTSIYSSCIKKINFKDAKHLI